MDEINKIGNTGDKFPLVTPENALAYLKAKGIVNIKGKQVNFLLIRKKLIPYYFGATEFCNLVNQAKKAKFDGATFRDAVNGVFGNLLYQRLKNSPNITFEEVNALIGTLFNMFNVKEKKEKIKKTTQTSISKAIDADAKEMKSIWELLRRVVGEKYKVFVARFFSDMKKYDEPVMENVVDIIINLMKDKQFNIKNTEDTLFDLIDCLQRMRMIKNKKNEKK